MAYHQSRDGLGAWGRRPS